MLRATLVCLLLVTCSVLGGSLTRNVCNSPFALRDTSKPTTVVGNGTPASCNQQALVAALLKGGVITFQCGSQPVTISLNSELLIAKTNTTIDGGSLVTLNGDGKTRIINFDAGDFRYPTPTLTVQRLRFINGRCQDSEGGCAIFQKLGGTTVVIDSTFENNVGPTTGQDTAGGAIWTIGGGDTTIVGSVFRNNLCSNGGALGILGSGLNIYNTHFEKNHATGNGGNPGNGGNGGAISFDGQGRKNTICGTRFTNNRGNKFGGAFFRVSYAGNEQNNFDSVLVDNNYILESDNGLAGGLYLQGGSATIRNAVFANNSAEGAGGLFLANMKDVTVTNANFLENKAYNGLGAAIYCSDPVSAALSGLTVANNYAGAFGAAFAGCGASVTVSNTLIANNLVGNVWPPNACTSTMTGGAGVIQSPINKQSPAFGTDTPCASGSLKHVDNITTKLDKTTWKIQNTGTPVIYAGPTVIPGI